MCFLWKNEMKINYWSENEGKSKTKKRQEICRVANCVHISKAYSKNDESSFLSFYNSSLPLWRIIFEVNRMFWDFNLYICKGRLTSKTISWQKKFKMNIKKISRKVNSV